MRWVLHSYWSDLQNFLKSLFAVVPELGGHNLELVLVRKHRLVWEQMRQMLRLGSYVELLLGLDQCRHRDFNLLEALLKRRVSDSQRFVIAPTPKIVLVARNELLEMGDDSEVGLRRYVHYTVLEN